jgi:hypothetical protein
MFNRRRTSKDLLDSVAGEITRSAGLTDQESDETVLSPLFLVRLRARIDRDHGLSKAAQSGQSASMLVVGWMKLALSAIVIVAAIAFWLVRVQARVGPEAELAPADPAPALTACSITATSACAISTGDVLELLLAKNIQESPK